MWRMWSIQVLGLSPSFDEGRVMCRVSRWFAMSSGPLHRLLSVAHLDIERCPPGSSGVQVELRSPARMQACAPPFIAVLNQVRARRCR